MALQIAPIKASRRKILPNLNTSRYEQSMDVLGRTTYRRKGSPIKSERKTSVNVGGKQRISLENKALAKRTARQRQGAAIPKDRFNDWINRPRTETGKALKNGIIGMAKKSGITDEELFRKLQAMDESKLQMMYDQDQLIFDVAFTYNEDGTYGDKEGDLAFLVSEYEKKYNVIL